MVKPRLIILRGNSGSGKSTIAHELRMRMGYGTAVVEQDYIRRHLLREQDKPGQPNIELIQLTTQFAVNNGYDAIVEGILPTDKYGRMLHQLIADHPGKVYVYYLKVSFEETVRRHSTRQKSGEFDENAMRQWYKKDDVLGLKTEQVLPEAFTLEQTVNHILADIS